MAPVALKVWELVSVVLAAGVAGMFVGPWAALTRSIASLEPEVFLAVVRRMNRNMEQVMTVLMPAATGSIVPVLWLTHGVRARTFYADVAGLGMLLVALVVTLVVEVPIVKQIVTWTPETLPEDWEALRDRWSRFHLVRIGAGVGGFVALVAGLVF